MNDLKQPDAISYAAVLTLASLGYTYDGGEQWKPPVGNPPAFDLIDSLRDSIAELERANAAKHYRIVELEAQLEAVGAGSVEPLRKREQDAVFSPMWLAPIDGTPVLLYMPTTTDNFAVGRWHGNFNSIDGSWGDDEGNFYVHEPAAWMNLKVLAEVASGARHLQAAPPAQAQEDARDAERYRWLRAQPNDVKTQRIDVVRWVDNGDVNNGEGLRLDSLDEAIDAAIRARSITKEQA